MVPKRHGKGSGGKKKSLVLKLLSNFEILNWVKKLKIKNFKRVYSRDNLPEITGCGILNVDDKTGEGTHWVCWSSAPAPNGGWASRIYFDPYGLPPPEEFRNKGWGLWLGQSPTNRYSDIQYQHKLSFLCGYFCLFFLKHIQDYDLYDVLYKQLHPNDRIYNEKLIMSYFKNE